MTTWLVWGWSELKAVAITSRFSCIFQNQAVCRYTHLGNPLLQFAKKITENKKTAYLRISQNISTFVNSWASSTDVHVKRCLKSCQKAKKRLAEKFQLESGGHKRHHNDKMFAATLMFCNKFLTGELGIWLIPGQNLPAFFSFNFDIVWSKNAAE